jgi:uncharacterized membrane protein
MPDSNLSPETVRDAVQRIRRAADKQLTSIVPDSRSGTENGELEIARLREELRELKATNRRNRLTYVLQTQYIPRLFDLNYRWIVFVAVVLVLSGVSVAGFNNPDCHIGCINFRLSEKVLITLLSTTTVTVVGLFYAVVKWLYPVGTRGNGQKATKQRQKHGKKF